MSHYVYEVTNNLNGMVYIGARAVEKRLPTSKGYLGSGKLIKKAVADIGRENFTKKVLCITSEEHAYWLESKIVNEEFVAREDTYNIKTGGKGGGTKGIKLKPLSESAKQNLREKNLGKKLTKETRIKISESNKGIARPKDAEYRRKISDGLKGNTNRRGKKTSDSAKEKIREARAKQVITDETKKKISEALKGKKHEKVTCDHCGKVGGVTGMKRWHFDNCKNKI